MVNNISSYFGRKLFFLAFGKEVNCLHYVASFKFRFHIPKSSSATAHRKPNKPHLSRFRLDCYFSLCMGIDGDSISFSPFSSAVLMLVRFRLCGENYLILRNGAVLGYECCICWYLFSPGRF
ncbi:hypothetical protein CEXT_766001 [Caerostris extrusa]|uniref:Uncharacterized protein n=1 Tax=Caerostris extrusa TaxID=172846 RepID=A0AAV4N762_CAEEX|nr:hypothetical protein CEXT_766001 [Caerostris extrusa]